MRWRSSAALLLALTVLLVGTAPVAALPAAAAPNPSAVPAPTPSAATVTWTVRPSDGQSEDGRRWIEQELAPGETVTEHLSVRNLSPMEVTFRLSAADGYFSDTGRFNMLTADRQSVEAGTWISLPETVVVASGAEAVVPFTVTVPPDATPGDHPAGVAASIRSGESEGVGVESRVGFRVMTRVLGELAPAAATTLSASYQGSIVPFTPGVSDVSYEVRNTGNVRMAVQSALTWSGPFGWFETTVAGDPINEIAPGETRTLHRELPAVWPWFVTTIGVEHTLSPVADGLAFPTPEPVGSSVVVPTIPWSSIVLIVLAVGVVALWWAGRRRRAARTQALIDDVRRQTLLEAGALRTRGWIVAVVLGAAVWGASAGAPPAAASDAETATQSLLIVVEVAHEPPSRGGGATPQALAITGVDLLPMLCGAGLLIAVGAIVLARARRMRRG